MTSFVLSPDDVSDPREFQASEPPDPGDNVRHTTAPIDPLPDGTGSPLPGRTDAEVGIPPPDMTASSSIEVNATAAALELGEVKSEDEGDKLVMPQGNHSAALPEGGA
ncbi:hypothetical protein JAAARDRAFT_187386 [Jaapia argillacea MUCL 33604]|uniref:Uncharacterized protein n=1 Tax=Jaapia argillacea MUCL 33604 TaxID=933084 RepID=A0A067QN09_9AGAM|nr:hypothetical protein JAAARDRAFT_187386 [Jaapia argillacea MUCL 33604]